MQIFKPLTSQVILLDMNNVDTDMIIPAQFLTNVDREGYGKYLFQRLREQDADFVFNDPKSSGREILLSRANFGCGSSREHAVWALMQANIKVIIAESYSDIFYNNAAKNGLLAISLEPNIIASLIKQVKQKDIALSVDLTKQTITTSMHESFHFNYDSFRKECLLKGQDDLDYLLEATNA